MNKVLVPQRIRSNCFLSILLSPVCFQDPGLCLCLEGRSISNAWTKSLDAYNYRKLSLITPPMASTTTKPHQRPRPPLSPLRLDSISELPENQSSPYINLGAETPSSILKTSFTAPSVDEWSKSGLAVNTNVPARRRSWRSNSWSCSRSKGMARFQRERLDTDCGIW